MGRDLAKETWWRKHVAQCAADGARVQQYCQQHQLKVSAFYWWRSEIARRDAQENNVTPTPAGAGDESFDGVADGPNDVSHSRQTSDDSVGFAELVLAGGREPLAADEVEVRLRDSTRLRFRNGCDVELIVRVIAALGERTS